MDLRAYYKKIRDVESGIQEPFVVVVGTDTPDGGKAGTRSEAAKHIAAKLVVEGRARLATDEESKAFREEHAEARREAEATAAAQRMQVTIVPNTDYRAKPTKSSKE